MIEKYEGNPQFREPLEKILLDVRDFYSEEGVEVERYNFKIRKIINRSKGYLGSYNSSNDQMEFDLRTFILDEIWIGKRGAFVNLTSDGYENLFSKLNFGERRLIANIPFLHEYFGDFFNSSRSERKAFPKEFFLLYDKMSFDLLANERFTSKEFVPLVIHETSHRLFHKKYSPENKPKFLEMIDYLSRFKESDENLRAYQKLIFANENASVRLFNEICANKSKGIKEKLNQRYKKSDIEKFLKHLMIKGFDECLARAISNKFSTKFSKLSCQDIIPYVRRGMIIEEKVLSELPSFLKENTYSALREMTTDELIEKFYE